VAEALPSGSNVAVLNQLAGVARRTAFECGDTSVTQAEVYGPDAHLAISQALHDDHEAPQAEPHRDDGVSGAFYLIVLRGDFVHPHAGTAARELLQHYATAAQVWSPEWGYTNGGALRLAPTPLAILAPIEGPLSVRLDYHQPVGPLVDHGSRYQLLDHAADVRSLWECRHGIVIDPAEGEPYTLHRERAPAELRPELERLMTENLVHLLVWSDSERRPLSRDEAQQALADDRNWYAPYELGETERRSVAYCLGYTDSGREVIRREHARTQAIDGRLGQRTDLHLYDRSGNRMLRRPPLRRRLDNP
jgi:hypothetical protein